MEETGRWAPEVLTVFEPVPLAVGDLTLGLPSPAYHQALTDAALRRIRKQLRRQGAGEWPLASAYGRIAPSIVATAAERDSEWIVLGLGRHGKLARLFGAETVTRVARQSAVPIFAVDERARALPRSAVAAVDFGPSSVRAAREMLTLLSPDGRLHLLHVRWGLGGETARDVEWERTYDLGVEEAFRQLLRQLRVPSGVEVTTELRTGDVVAATLATAEALGADAIAVGSHNQSMVDRLLIGYTPAQLLRAAKCSVLMAPPAAAEA